MVLTVEGSGDTLAAKAANRAVAELVAQAAQGLGLEVRTLPDGLSGREQARLVAKGQLAAVIQHGSRCNRPIIYFDVHREASSRLAHNLAALLPELTGRPAELSHRPRHAVFGLGSVAHAAGVVVLMPGHASRADRRGWCERLAAIIARAAQRSAA